MYDEQFIKMTAKHSKQALKMIEKIIEDTRPLVRKLNEDSTNHIVKTSIIRELDRRRVTVSKISQYRNWGDRGIEMFDTMREEEENTEKLQEKGER